MVEMLEPYSFQEVISGIRHLLRWLENVWLSYI